MSPFYLTFFWVFPLLPSLLNRFRAGMDMGRGKEDTKNFLHTFEKYYFLHGIFGQDHGASV